MRLIKTFVAAAASLGLATSAYAQSSITNPTPNFTSVGSVVTKIFTWLIGIIGVLAVVFIIIGGIRYILARGDPKATDSARNTITAAIIGLVIALLAVSIVILVGNGFFGAGGGFSPTTIGF